MNYSTLSQRFESLYHTSPTVIASAPGRLEILGNHTDYNGGLTLSCAVDFRCTAAIAPISESAILMMSEGFDETPIKYSLKNLLLQEHEGHWGKYIIGLVVALQERRLETSGFALLVDSKIPASAGLSSSAALEMAVLTGLLEMMGQRLPKLEMAKIGQWAESRAAGAKTGLLDQLSSLCGQKNHFLQIDFASNKQELIPLPEGYVLVVVDSGVKHDLTLEYNERRESCEAAAKALGVSKLSEATLEQLLAKRNAMPEIAYRRALHILNENKRVREAKLALSSGQVVDFGKLMFESHASSQENFENSCPELDRLVAFARADKRCLGARLSGGGFGGVTIHLVRASDANAYRNAICLAFAKEHDKQRWNAICVIDDGARLEKTALES